jgi:hypothetical protein
VWEPSTASGPPRIWNFPTYGLCANLTLIDYDGAVAATRDALGVEAFTPAWDEGRAMTLQEAITHALEEPATQEEGEDSHYMSVTETSEAEDEAHPGSYPDGLSARGGSARAAGRGQDEQADRRGAVLERFHRPAPRGERLGQDRGAQADTGNGLRPEQGPRQNSPRTRSP